jgi:oligoendopeptidase F
MQITRKDVPQNDCWNLEPLYPNIQAWQQELATISSFDEISKHKGSLGTFEKLLETLDLYFSIERKLRKLYTYAHLRHDEDTAEEEPKKAYHHITTLYHKFSQDTAWLQPEILALSDETLQKLVEHPKLLTYAFFLEKLRRLKSHTLSEDQEFLIALAQQAMDAPKKAFSAINNADFRFGEVQDSQGKSHLLTHASYGVFIRSHDRELRKNTFQSLHKKYSEYKNTLSELLAGQMQNHWFEAKAHKYASCLDAALFPKNIDTEVYHSLIMAINDGLESLQRYLKLRKQLLGVEELHFYDLYVPLVPAFDLKFSYEEAETLVIESSAPLGEEYTSLLHHGLTSGRWVDRYENVGKRSGAYSSGCYDSMPYILMNFKGILRDVFTLAHEVGHSMHSLYSRRQQPYHYSDYAIFVAEVASTFNEELLFQTLMKRSSSLEEKAFLINEKIEDIRGTLFRQAMFAEFELAIHRATEQGTPLTPQFFNETFLELNKRYFGDTLYYDEELACEWSRIPHFYYNFYVYQYATGVSAAIALSETVCSGGTKERDAYLHFLQSGSSDYPIALLQKAGVDMKTQEPVRRTIKKFNSLVDELEKLLAVQSSKC